MTRGSMIDIISADGARFPGYLARPAQGSGPGLVLVHEMVGLNDFMRAMAERLAEEAYVCLVPDLYWRQEAGVNLGYNEADFKRAQALHERFDIELALSDIHACASALRAQSAHCGKLGIIGWSMGGLLATLAAARFDFDCAVSYYAVGLDSIRAARTASPMPPTRTTTSPPR